MDPPYSINLAIRCTNLYAHTHAHSKHGGKERYLHFGEEIEEKIKETGVHSKRAIGLAQESAVQDQIAKDIVLL